MSENPDYDECLAYEILLHGRRYKSLRDLGTMKRKDFRNMRHGTHHNNSFRALSFAYLVAGSGRSPNSWFDFRLPRGRNRSSLLAQHHYVIAYSGYHWPNAVPTANADASLKLQRFKFRLVTF
jgi:hypothetical protein